MFSAVKVNVLVLWFSPGTSKNNLSVIVNVLVL